MKQSELDALERQRQALELRKAGVSYQTIADRLGYASTGGAHKAVASALKKTLQEPADQLRNLELERLDMAAMAIAQSVKQGNYGAIDRWLRIMERRAKLLGLDAPTKIDQNNTGETKVIIEYADVDSNTPPLTPGADPDKAGTEEA